jgi:hypothetical protein
MNGLEEWLPPASAGTETGLSTAQVTVRDIFCLPNADVFETNLNRPAAQSLG